MTASSRYTRSLIFQLSQTDSTWDEEEGNLHRRQGKGYEEDTGQKVADELACNLEIAKMRWRTYECSA